MCWPSPAIFRKKPAKLEVSAEVFYEQRGLVFCAGTFLGVACAGVELHTHQHEPRLLSTLYDAGPDLTAGQADTTNYVCSREMSAL